MCYPKTNSYNRLLYFGRILMLSIDEVLFFIFVITLTADILFSAIWFRFYFKLGMPIFFSKRRCDEVPLKKIINEQKNSKNEVFYRFIFKTYSNNEIAFRDKIFINWQTPIMHGLIIFSDEKEELSIVGYINWYFIPFLLYFIFIFASSPLKNEITTVLFLMLIVILSIYLPQFYRYNSLLKAIFEHKE